MVITSDDYNQRDNADTPLNNYRLDPSPFNSTNITSGTHWVGQVGATVHDIIPYWQRLWWRKETIS